KLSELELIKHFGKSGSFFYRIVRGIDDREVRTHRDPKSVGAEDTFPFDLTSIEDMQDELLKITRNVHNRMLRKELKGRTLTLKIKYHDFKIATRSHSFPERTDDRETIYKTAVSLLTESDLTDKKIRLLGISMSNFRPPAPTVAPGQSNAATQSGQLSLF